jgi:NADPH:quinone reductase-like Zn-dependent oxidoreductase
MSIDVETIKKQKVYELTADFGIEALKLQERQTGVLKDHEVLVKVMAVSLNYRDLLVIKGLYSKRLPFPLIPVSDGAGEVVEVGEQVTRVKPGDRVAAIFMQKWLAGAIKKEYVGSALGGAVDGMLADYVVLPEDGLVSIPDYLSYAEAATLPCAGVTAWNAVVASGKVKPGDTLLTMGTGGVSIFALQFARMNGARVIVTSSSDEKLERAKGLGASELINYKQNTDWAKAALELTDNIGVDQVVELGGAGTLDQSLKAVRVGGHVSLIGVLSAGSGSGFNPMQVLMKNVCLQGIYVGSRQMFEDMERAMSLARMKPIIDRVFEFSQTREALKFMESQAHFGKIVISVPSAVQ